MQFKMEEILSDEVQFVRMMLRRAGNRLVKMMMRWAKRLVGMMMRWGNQFVRMMMRWGANRLVKAKSSNCFQDSQP